MPTALATRPAPRHAPVAGRPCYGVVTFLDNRTPELERGTPDPRDRADYITPRDESDPHYVPRH